MWGSAAPRRAMRDTGCHHGTFPLLWLSVCCRRRCCCCCCVQLCGHTSPSCPIRSASSVDLQDFISGEGGGVWGGVVEAHRRDTHTHSSPSLRGKRSSKDTERREYRGASMSFRDHFFKFPYADGIEVVCITIECN